MLFRITEAARHAGVSPSALRLWEQQGLVTPRRSGGRYRLYSAGDLSRLREIARLRQVEGLNAAAIRRLAGETKGAPEANGLPGSAAVPRPVRPAPTSIGLEVATRLRRLRSQAGLTLRAAAERTGLSASFISSLERAQTGASLAALRRLTAAYGTTLGELLHESGLAHGRHVPASERPILEAGRGIRLEDLAPGAGQLESQLFVLAPGATSDGYYAHAGEELMFLLTGSLAVWLDEREYYELSPGDALTFPSTLAHRFAALGTSETRLIWINTPPTF